MSEISINTQILGDKIEELIQLQNKCSEIQTWRKKQTKYGSGEVIDLLEAIDQEYCSLMEDFDTLISNSISFFNNMLESVQNTDTQAGNNFN